MNQIIQANNKSFYLYLKLSRLKKLQKKTQLVQNLQPILQNEKEIAVSFLFKLFYHVNQLVTNASHHTETSQLICDANELTGFCMMGNIDH